MKSSMETRSIPMLMPAFVGMWNTGYGLPSRLAKATAEFASVLILMPNHATK